MDSSHPHFVEPTEPSVFYEQLADLSEPSYAEFQARLVPTIAPERILGVRVPALRALARQLERDNAPIATFLDTLPHEYYDENMLHGLLISRIRDPHQCLARLDAFAPHIDNWATCDIISPTRLGRHPDILMPAIKNWLGADHEFTVRLGVSQLLTFFMGPEFSVEHFELLRRVDPSPYYVRMAIAWYFATALTKHYQQTLPSFRTPILDVETHNKAIQKACESRVISPEQKAELRALKLKRPAT